MTLYLFRHNPKGQCKEIRRINLDDNPCPTIMAGGYGATTPAIIGWRWREMIE